MLDHYTAQPKAQTRQRFKDCGYTACPSHTVAVMERLLVLLLLFFFIVTVGSETTNYTTCFAPPAYLGEMGSLTCNFNIDVAETKRSFSVRRADRQDFDLKRDTILDCDWIEGKQFCSTIKDGFTYDTRVSKRLTIIINNVTLEHKGEYLCQYFQAAPHTTQSCTITVSERQLPSPEPSDGVTPKTLHTDPPKNSPEAQTKQNADDSGESNGIVKIVVPIVVIAVVLIVAIVVAVLLKRRCAQRHPKEANEEAADKEEKTEEDDTMLKLSSDDVEDDKKTDEKEKLVEDPPDPNYDSCNFEDDDKPPPRPLRAHEREAMFNGKTEAGIGEPETEDQERQPLTEDQGVASHENEDESATNEKRKRKGSKDSDKGDEGDSEDSNKDSSDDEGIEKKEHKKKYKPVVKQLSVQNETGEDPLHPVPDKYKRASAQRNMRHLVNP